MTPELITNWCIGIIALIAVILTIIEWSKKR